MLTSAHTLILSTVAVVAFRKIFSEGTPLANRSWTADKVPRLISGRSASVVMEK